jgi:uncharacterized protein (TIGR01777 family)
MKVFLTGGTGFIGQHVVHALIDRGAECVVVSRDGRDPWGDPRVRVVRGDPTRSGPWQGAVGGTDAAVNLAGMPIVAPPHRWTQARKAMIRASRIETTHCLVEAMRAAEAAAPRVLLSASGVDYYGSRGDALLDETAPPGEGFLADVCIEWEEAARTAQDVARVVLLRNSLVLGADGGVLQPMLTPFRLGLGGSWGNGRQWWSWVHVADVVGMITFLIERDVGGAVNVAAPNPVRADAFAKTLGTSLGRPTFARVPEIALRVALGEAADPLLSSQRALPRRLQEAGYAFRFPELAGALAEIVGR